jgi:hypothetical protein
MGELFTGFWMGGPKGKRPFGRPRLRWEEGYVGRTGFDWLRIGSSGKVF